MEESVKCSKCNTFLKEGDIFCQNCGYPEGADQQEKNKYEFRINNKKKIIKDAEKKMKNVKILLYVIAGINFLFGMYYLSDDVTFADGIANLLATAIFLGCVVWVNKQPLIGILGAFVFWILIQLSVVFVDPILLFQGIILKVIFVGIFLKGINSARDYQKFSEQLKEMNAN